MDQHFPNLPMLWQLVPIGPRASICAAASIRHTCRRAGAIDHPTAPDHDVVHHRLPCHQTPGRHRQAGREDGGNAGRPCRQRQHGGSTCATTAISRIKRALSRRREAHDLRPDLARRPLAGRPFPWRSARLNCPSNAEGTIDRPQPAHDAVASSNEHPTTPIAASRSSIGADLLMADVLRVRKVRSFGDRPAIETYVTRVTDRAAFKTARADQLAHFAAADESRSAAG